MEGDKNGCGWRHLKLVGLIISIVLAVVAAGLAWNNGSIREVNRNVDELEVRVRVGEQQRARIEERLQAIQVTADRIEKKLDRR